MSRRRYFLSKSGNENKLIENTALETKVCFRRWWIDRSSISSGICRHTRNSHRSGRPLPHSAASSCCVCVSSTYVTCLFDPPALAFFLYFKRIFVLYFIRLNVKSREEHFEFLTATGANIDVQWRTPGGSSVNYETWSHILIRRFLAKEGYLKLSRHLTARSMRHSGNWVTSFMFPLKYSNERCWFDCEKKRLWGPPHRSVTAPAKQKAESRESRIRCVNTRVVYVQYQFSIRCHHQRHLGLGPSNSAI